MVGLLLLVKQINDVRFETYKQKSANSMSDRVKRTMLVPFEKKF